MTLFVREYSWMWNDLRLSLAECRVYAYIYGLSHGVKKCLGWHFERSAQGLPSPRNKREHRTRDPLRSRRLCRRII